VNGIWQDVVLDVRTHLKPPIVTAAIVASLAFGLAATSARRAVRLEAARALRHE